MIRRGLGLLGPLCRLGLIALAALTVLGGCSGGGRDAARAGLSACMDPAEARSADVRRNLGALRGAPICYRRQAFGEGSFRWVFHVLEHTGAPDGPFWVLPHDNENAAFDAGVHAVLTYGGGLLAVDTGGSRSFRGQDPNRNFSRSRSESRLCSGQRRASPRFTTAILDHYRGRPGPYLALHNNGNGHAGNGGSGNLSMALARGPLTSWPGAAVGSPALRDEDNLVFMAGRRTPAMDANTRRRIAALNRAGLNVMHKQVTDRSFDCSMSDYIARHRLGDYYNIEAEHGARRTQVEMVDRLMAAIGIRPLRRAAPNPFLD